MTVLVMFLVGRADAGKHIGGWGLTWRTAVAGSLMPIGMAVLSIPSSLFGGDDPNATAQAIIFSVELVLVALIAIPVLEQWARVRRGHADGVPSRFVRVFGPVYLGVLAVLWITALPDHFGAVDGITDDGTPIGSLLYAG